MAEIRRVSEIRKPGPEVRVERVLDVEHADYLILSPSLSGFATHYFGKPDGTKACTLPKEECQGCRQGKPLRDKFYLHCLRINKRLQVFLELTPYGALELQDQAPAGEEYRGFKIRVYRSSGKAKGRQHLEILAMEKFVGPMPEPKDPYDTLKFLWGIAEVAPNTLKAFVG